MSTGRRLVLLAFILAVGTGLRCWGIQFGLPLELARPDEEKIAQATFHILQGDFNPHFFLYPSLFIYLTAAVYAALVVVERALGTSAVGVSVAAGAIADPARLHLVARGLAAASGIATIAVLYGAASELFARRAALAAAAFLAVAFLHVRDSHFGVTDVPVTLLTVCAFWAAARIATRGVTLVRAAVTGLLCGLAASTKYNAALIALPALVAIAGHGFIVRRVSVMLALASAVALAIGLIAGFLAGTPFAVLDRPAFLADIEAQQEIASGRGHGGSIIDPAREVNRGIRGWQYHLTNSLRYGLGLPLLIAGLLGACWLAIEDPQLAAVVLSFPIAYYAVMGISLLVYARWMVPIIPFLCLTAGVLVDRLAKVAGSLTANRHVPAICAIVLVLAVGSPAAARSVAFDQLMTRTDTRLLAAQWIEARFPAGVTVYQTGMLYGYVQLHPRERFPQQAFDRWPGFFAEQRRSGRDLPELVIVMDSPLSIFSQVPAELSPVLGESYHQLATFRGIAADDPSGAVYDQQDAFYVPFANLTGIRRPGPTIRVFERRRDE